MQRLQRVWNHNTTISKSHFHHLSAPDNVHHFRHNNLYVIHICTYLYTQLIPDHNPYIYQSKRNLTYVHKSNTQMFLVECGCACEEWVDSFDGIAIRFRFLGAQQASESDTCQCSTSYSWSQHTFLLITSKMPISEI